MSDRIAEIRREELQHLVPMFEHLGLILLEKVLPGAHDGTPDLRLTLAQLQELLEPLFNSSGFWLDAPLAQVSTKEGLRRLRQYWPMTAPRDRARLLFYFLGAISGGSRGRKNWARQGLRKLQLQSVGKKGAQLWSHLAADAFKVYLEGDEPGLPPALLWEPIVSTAWDSCGFHKQVLHIMRRFILERVLLPGEDRFIPLINNPTFWALIALTSIHEDETPGSGDKRALGFFFSLRNVAAQKANTANWASYWDQWVLLRALKSSSSQEVGPTAELRESLSDLPLRNDHDAHPRIDLAHPDWAADMPSWHGLLSGL